LLRDVDTVARLGGDEFAFVLPRTDREGAALAARKVLQELRRPLALNGRPISVTGSVGIASFPEHGSNPDELLQRADIAMYTAKRGGFGYAMYTPGRDRGARRRLTLLTEVREGMERGQFSFDYQPIVNVQTGAPVMVEALVRWDHPRQGRLLPAEFMELAEHSWLIEPLTMVLLDESVGEWVNGGGRPPASLAVNLSPKTLRDQDFPERIANVMRAHGASPSMLVLEITESMLMSDSERTASCLAALSNMGFRLAIDDFGVGFSSLSYLHRLPVHQLKIDHSFAQGLARGEDAIVRATIDMAHDLGLTVVAEGVESDAVLGRLRELGCDAAQGNFIAAPASAPEVRRWISRKHAAGTA
jgi:EAL domain-containing protein (putative c-di-GMP-specific phosphodiesterase class I)